MDHFCITYHVTVYESEEIHKKVDWICLEQSVEVPRHVLSREIDEQIVGKPVTISKISQDCFEVVISWPLANIGDDPTQFLNILYGNISLKKGIRVVDLEWEKLVHILKGPGIGIDAMRATLNLPKRPLICGVLKPMGLNATELAGLAGEMARGGIDLIKDDHGLTNQKYAPFEERVSTVMKALHSVEEQTGHRARYFPHITTSGSKVFERYKRCEEFGVDGVMVIPHALGYEAMHELARSEIDLPIIAHPAFSGALLMDEAHGFTPSFLYGGLFRAFGADCVVYPNSGGRFSFSDEECERINSMCRRDVQRWKSSFPMPGGGMKKETIGRWAQKYGRDTIFLIGASLLEFPEGIEKGAHELQNSLKKPS